jgi:hypothetical protein
MTTEVLKQSIKLAKANKRIEELEGQLKDLEQQLDMAVKLNIKELVKAVKERAK